MACRFRMPLLLVGVLCLSSLAVTRGDDRPLPGSAGNQRPIAGFTTEVDEGSPIERAISKALRTPVRVDFNETPMADALYLMADRQEIPLNLDKTALTGAGIRPETPITLQLNGASLASALRLITEPLALETRIVDDTLLVTTQAKARDLLLTTTYNFADLDDEILENLAAVIQNIVARDSWSEPNGPGKLIRLRNGLIIRQTTAVHREITELLEDIGHTLLTHKGQPGSPRNLAREAEAAIDRKLATRGNLKCQKQPLKEVLTALGRSHGLAFWLNEAALADEAIATDALLTFDHEQMPLELILKLLLTPLQLEYVVQDDVVQVTTRAKADEILVTRTYDVRNLAGAAAPPSPGSPRYLEARLAPALARNNQHAEPAAESWRVNWIRDSSEVDGWADLMQILTETIAPESWSERGGPGSLAQFDDVLIVRQSRKVQREIARVLARLQQVAAAAKRLAPPANATEPLDLLIYPIATGAPRDLAAAIAAMIAPESWERGTIHAVEGALLVCQTRSVHQQIWKFLKALPGVPRPPTPARAAAQAK